MLVAGTYRNSLQCEKVRDRLRAEHFPPQKVAVSTLERGVVRDRVRIGTKGLMFGAWGAGIGAGLGLIASLVLLAIPQFSAMLGVRPFMFCLTAVLELGMAIGVLGGVIGFLTPAYEVRTYQTRLENGGALVSVAGKDEEELQGAEKILKAGGAIDILWLSGNAPLRAKRPTGGQDAGEIKTSG